jgi:hypothetical protein
MLIFSCKYYPKLRQRAPRCNMSSMNSCKIGLSTVIIDAGKILEAYTVVKETKSFLSIFIILAYNKIMISKPF